MVPCDKGHRCSYFEVVSPSKGLGLGADLPINPPCGFLLRTYYDLYLEERGSSATM